MDAGENLVAICDIDTAFVERQLAGKLRPNREGVVSPAAIKLRDAYAKAAKYADFREMLDKQKDIEAVIIATPDHLHATVAVAAMRAGKHVYVQKPLTYSVYEARLLATGRRGDEGRDADGEPGTLARRHSAHPRLDQRRRHRAGARGAHLDRPASAVLGAGDPGSDEIPAPQTTPATPPAAPPAGQPVLPPRRRAGTSAP